MRSLDFSVYLILTPSGSTNKEELLRTFPLVFDLGTLKNVRVWYAHRVSYCQSSNNFCKTDRLGFLLIYFWVSYRIENPPLRSQWGMFPYGKSITEWTLCPPALYHLHGVLQIKSYPQLPNTQHQSFHALAGPTVSGIFLCNFVLYLPKVLVTNMAERAFGFIGFALLHLCFSIISVILKSIFICPPAKIWFCDSLFGGGSTVGVITFNSRNSRTVFCSFSSCCSSLISFILFSPNTIMFCTDGTKGSC